VLHVQSEHIPNKNFNKEPRQKYVQKKDGRKKQGTAVENPIILDKTRTENAEVVHKKGKLPVPHQGVGTSNIPHLNPSPVIQNNRFHALALDELMKVQANVLEAEVNEELEALRNQDNYQELNGDDQETKSTQEESEFVDAMQHELVNMPEEDIDEGEAETASRNEIPSRIQQDMAFINQSWANIMEDEDAEARMLTELEQAHDEDKHQHGINTDDF
jgi:hypothetical protein